MNKLFLSFLMSAFKHFISKVSRRIRLINLAYLPKCGLFYDNFYQPRVFCFRRIESLTCVVGETYSI